MMTYVCSAKITNVFCSGLRYTLSRINAISNNQIPMCYQLDAIKETKLCVSVVKLVIGNCRLLYVLSYQKLGLALYIYI